MYLYLFVATEMKSHVISLLGMRSALPLAGFLKAKNSIQSQTIGKTGIRSGMLPFWFCYLTALQASDKKKIYIYLCACHKNVTKTTLGKRTQDHESHVSWM